MKIAIDPLFLYSCPCTGISTYTKELIFNLSKLSSVETVVLYIGNQQKEIKLIKESLRGSNYEFRQVPYPGKVARTLWLLVDYPNINKFTRDIEIFHAPFFVTPALDKSKRLVVTIHDVAPLIFPDFFPLMTRLAHTRRLKKIRYKMKKNSNTHLIADSDHTKRDLVKHLGISENKISTIPLGVSSIFKPLNDSLSNKMVLRKYSLSKPYILTVGSLNPRKNITSLLKAYSRLTENSKINHQLVLIGTSGWLNKKIFKEVRINKNVKLMGTVPEEDLPILYSQADLFVFPSIYEGFGLPVLEAMACGTPVITSNASSLPEVSGQAARLVDPHDISEIANSISYVLSNNPIRKKMIDQGLQWAKNFTWEKTAQRTYELYKNIVTQKM